MLLVPKNRHRVNSPKVDNNNMATTSTQSETIPSSAQDHSQDNSSSILVISPMTVWFLRFCKLLNIVTAFGNLLGIITNLMMLSIPAPVEEVSLRIYGIAFCFVSLLTEFEWQRLFSWFGFMENWIGRGILNIFSGVLILDFENSNAASSSEAEGGAARTWLLRNITGHFLIATGLLYAFCGVVCLNRIKEGYVTKLKKRDQVRKERAELESRKHEIEMLLRDTESQLRTFS